MNSISWLPIIAKMILYSHLFLTFLIFSNRLVLAINLIGASNAACNSCSSRVLTLFGSLVYFSLCLNLVCPSPVILKEYCKQDNLKIGEFPNMSIFEKIMEKWERDNVSNLFWYWISRKTTVIKVSYCCQLFFTRRRLVWLVSSCRCTRFVI